jgi:hypothetical protein
VKSFRYRIIYQRIHQSDGQSPLRADLFRSYKHFESNAFAHKPWQSLRSAPSRD